MIALLIGIAAVVGVGVGWYGHRVSLRIEAWGRGMDECDEIFRSVTERTVSSKFEDGRRRISRDGPSIAPFVTSRLRH